MTCFPDGNRSDNGACPRGRPSTTTTARSPPSIVTMTTPSAVGGDTGLRELPPLPVISPPTANRRSTCGGGVDGALELARPATLPPASGVSWRDGAAGSCCGDP